MNIKKFLNLTYYVSEADQFLSEFDKIHPKLSVSQQREKAKFERIARLRDQPTPQNAVTPALWDKF